MEKKMNIDEKKYSLTLRVWHWLNAIAVLGLVGTVILRKTFLSWRDNSALIVSKFAEFDIVVTAEQATKVAKAIRAPMWEWHIIFGFIFAALVLFRLFMIYKNGFEYPKDTTLHMSIVYKSYKVLYAIMAFMALSGLILYFNQNLGLSKDLTHDIKELHENISWAIMIFVPLHIIGVFKAENRDQKGIVSKMISGN
jgi:Ni/Fe-hydrogenase 1 B-type cytochrome subunit